MSIKNNFGSITEQLVPNILNKINCKKIAKIINYNNNLYDIELVDIQEGQEQPIILTEVRAVYYSDIKSPYIIGDYVLVDFIDSDMRYFNEHNTQNSEYAKSTHSLNSPIITAKYELNNSYSNTKVYIKGVNALFTDIVNTLSNMLSGIKNLKIISSEGTPLSVAPTTLTELIEIENQLTIVQDTIDATLEKNI